jgi:membrane protein
MFAERRESGFSRLLGAAAYATVLVLAARSRPETGDRPGGVAAQQPARGDQAGTMARGAESGRGRQAVSPLEIPWTGWKDILWRVYAEVGNDRLMAIAAGVVFYSLLALFPAITAGVSIYALFADAGTIGEQLASLSSILPGGAIEIISEQIKRIIAQGASGLTFGFIIGLAVAFWSANAAMKAIFDALNVIYEEEEKRGFIKLNLITMLFTLAGIALVLVMIASVTVLPIVLGYLGLGSAAEVLLRIGRWPVMFVIVVGALAVLYRYGPSRTRAQWRWLTVGSVFAAVVWMIASMAFSWYVANFGSYNATYGSLGAAIGMMMWMWISTIVVLVGAEIDAEIEHQTAKDSTTGPAKPLGQRGATMADTVGAAQ